MKNTEDFSKNPNIKTEDDKPLDSDMIIDFIQANGEAQAIGYIKALKHFAMELEYALYDIEDGRIIDERPLGRIRNNICKLLVLKENFITHVDEKKIVDLKNEPS